VSNNIGTSLMTEVQADRMAQRLVRAAEMIEVAYGYDFSAMPVRVLERLSDWYGRLCWLADRCERFAFRQSQIDGILKARAAIAKAGGEA